MLCQIFLAILSLNIYIIISLIQGYFTLTSWMQRTWERKLLKRTLQNYKFSRFSWCKTGHAHSTGVVITISRSPWHKHMVFFSSILKGTTRNLYLSLPRANSQESKVNTVWRSWKRFHFPPNRPSKDTIRIHLRTIVISMPASTHLRKKTRINQLTDWLTCETCVLSATYTTICYLRRHGTTSS